MSTKKLDTNIQKAFKKESSFDIEFEREMLMHRFLSEIEKICEEQNITKKELAEKIGTSASYITQIFRGTKTVNLETLAKFQHALDFKFEISAARNRTTFIDPWQDFPYNYDSYVGLESPMRAVNWEISIIPDYDSKIKGREKDETKIRSLVA